MSIASLACLVSFFLAGCTTPYTRPPFPSGTIVPKVACLNDSSQTYALYLPSGYSSNKTWPVVYGFDPGARGRIPVTLLRQGAEKYGFILVGSNNARNGPMAPILKAQEAMWKDVNSRFSIDPERSYSTGFSGGARVALHMARGRPDRFAGVISCGAFFSNSPNRSQTPDPETHPVVFGIVGDTCFNYPELMRADAWLKDAGITHWIEVFPGGHRWPSAPLMTEAIEFMHVVAMRNARVRRDKRLLKKLVRERLVSAKALETSGNKMLALRKYRQTSGFFEGIKGSRVASAQADRLLIDPDVQAHRKALERIQVCLNALRNPAQRDPFLDALRELKGIAGAKGSGPSRTAAGMLRTAHMVLTRAAFDAVRRKDYETAAKYFTLSCSVNEKDPVSPYNAACAHAMLKNKAEALRMLRTATEKGFRDVEKIRTDNDLESIREEPDFKAILDSIAP